MLLESVDGGKPIAATRHLDLPAAIDCLESITLAGLTRSLAKWFRPAATPSTYVQRVPVGVVAVIVPWNFALMNAVWNIAPALACGCHCRSEACRVDATCKDSGWAPRRSRRGCRPGALAMLFRVTARRRALRWSRILGSAKILVSPVRRKPDNSIMQRRGRKHYQSWSGVGWQICECRLRRRRS